MSTTETVDPKTLPEASDGPERAYKQWVAVYLQSRLPQGSNVTVNNSSLLWYVNPIRYVFHLHILADWIYLIRGKFYQYNNKDIELSTSQVNGTRILPGVNTVIAACGRKSSPSGTEGRFSVFDGNTRIFEIYFDVPWGASDNQFRIENRHPNYHVSQLPPVIERRGAIGTVLLEFVRMS